MKININSQEKIEAVLKTANGKRRANIATYQEICEVAARAQKQLDSLIARHFQTSAKVYFSPAGPYAASYKYTQGCTNFALVRGVRGWFLMGAEESYCYPKQREKCNLILNDEQKREAGKRFLNSMTKC